MDSLNPPPNEGSHPPRCHRILLFTSNLHGGGAERVLSRLASHWATQERSVTLVTIDSATPRDFPLPPQVERIPLNLSGPQGWGGPIRANWQRIQGLRQIIRQVRPEVILSFIDQANVVALLAARGLGIPVVISERADPRFHQIGRSWQWLRRRVYREAAALVVLSPEVAEWFTPLVARKRIVVIPNAISAPSDVAQRREPIVLAVGRLSPEKGFDRLIEVARSLHERGTLRDWRFVIVGEGPARAALAQQASELPAGTVEFAGWVADPAPWYARAGMFVLPSRYEGFPNVLLEAMAAGVPAVAFENSGTRQIIRDAGEGLLVPEGDVAAMGEAVERLILDEDARRKLGVAGKGVVSRFGEPEIYARWDRVIDWVSLANFPESLEVLSGLGE